MGILYFSTGDKLWFWTLVWALLTFLLSAWFETQNDALPFITEICIVCLMTAERGITKTRGVATANRALVGLRVRLLRSDWWEVSFSSPVADRLTLPKNILLNKQGSKEIHEGGHSYITSAQRGGRVSQMRTILLIRCVSLSVTRGEEALNPKRTSHVNSPLKYSTHVSINNGT